MKATTGTKKGKKTAAELKAQSDLIDLTIAQEKDVDYRTMMKLIADPNNSLFRKMILNYAADKLPKNMYNEADNIRKMTPISMEADLSTNRIRPSRIALNKHEIVDLLKRYDPKAEAVQNVKLQEIAQEREERIMYPKERFHTLLSEEQNKWLLRQANTKVEFRREVAKMLNNTDTPEYKASLEASGAKNFKFHLEGPLAYELNIKPDSVTGLYQFLKPEDLAKLGVPGFIYTNQSELEESKGPGNTQEQWQQLQQSDQQKQDALRQMEEEEKKRQDDDAQQQQQKLREKYPNAVFADPQTTQSRFVNQTSASSALNQTILSRNTTTNLNESLYEMDNIEEENKALNQSLVLNKSMIEASESEEEKDIATELINTLTTTQSPLAPVLRQIENSAVNGNITQQQAREQQLKFIHESAANSRSVQAQLQQTVQGIMQKTAMARANKVNLMNQQKYRDPTLMEKTIKHIQKADAYDQTKSLYSGAPVPDEYYTDVKNTNKQVMSQEQPMPKDVVPQVLVQAKAENNNVSKLQEHLEKLVRQHLGSKAAEKAQQMIDKAKAEGHPIEETKAKQMLEKAKASQEHKTNAMVDNAKAAIAKIRESDLAAKQAQQAIQGEHLALQRLPASQQVVTGLINNPKNVARQTSITDLVNDPKFVQDVNAKLQKAGCTPFQLAEAQRTLFDVGSFSTLLLEKGITSESANRQSVNKVVNSYIKSASQIQGDIHTQMTGFKNQTEVFATKTKKKESTQFTVKQGSAFLLRQC